MLRVRFVLLLLCCLLALPLVAACGGGSSTRPAVHTGASAQPARSARTPLATPAAISPRPRVTEPPPTAAAPAAHPTAPPVAVVSPTAVPTGAARTSAISVALGFYAAIQLQRYGQAYSYLAANATIDPTGDHPQPLTREVFLQMARQLDETMGKVTAYSAEADAADPTVIIMTISRSNLAVYHSHLQCQQVGGSWKIASLDRI